MDSDSHMDNGANDMNTIRKRDLEMYREWVDGCLTAEEMAYMHGYTELQMAASIARGCNIHDGIERILQCKEQMI